MWLTLETERENQSQYIIFVGLPKCKAANISPVCSGTADDFWHSVSLLRDLSVCYFVLLLLVSSCLRLL